MTDEFNAIYDILGHNHGKHLFDAQGTTPVRYTLDGSRLYTKTFSWHKAMGCPGFVFVDEILVN